MNIIFSGLLETISTRVDGSIRLTIGSNEMDSSKAGDLFQLRNKFLKVFMSDSNITEMQKNIIDEEIVLDGKKVKSASQRLRNTMFRLHQSQGISQDFDSWYKMEMEKIIDGYKELI